MELSDFARILRAHWLGILVLTLVGGLIALGWSATQSPRYEANASGFVTAGTVDSIGVASVSDSLAKSRAMSYVAIATGRPTARRVIDDLGLSTSPSELISHISVSQPTNTVLIEITANAGSPRGASELADAWIDALAAEVKEIEGGQDALSLRIVPIEAAAVPTAPVYPNTGLAVVIGLLSGLAVGIGYAVVRSRLDRRIRSAASVEGQFGVPVIGAIPTSPELGTIQLDPTALDRAAATVSGEAFRKLRTNLQFMDVDDPPRVIVVTSPNESEGKSTVATRFALTVAATGQPVILVDGDLRRPTIAERFGMEGAVGLTDVLAGTAAVNDVLQPWGRGIELAVLPAGRTPPNPSELLGSKAMSALLASLREGALVVIDAAPLLPVTDAAVLAARADGVFIVVAAGSTIDRDLHAAIAQVAAVNGRTLGVVLNRVAKGDRAAGDYSAAYPYAAVPPVQPAAKAATAKPVVRDDVTLG